MEIETPFGVFDLICYEETNTNRQHLVLKMGEWSEDDPVLTRVHAGSNTGELFARMLKHTANELHKTLNAIAEERKGVLLLLRYEEEGIKMSEIIKKLKKQKANDERLSPFIKREEETAKKILGSVLKFCMTSVSAKSAC